MIGDHPERPWQPHELTADLTFLRFHHGAPRPARQLLARPSSTSGRRALAELARASRVFAYFNNDWEGFAVRNALGLRERLAGKAAPGIHPRRDLLCS